MTPKVYLISRTLTDEQRERIQTALSITPLSAVVVADPRDVAMGMEFCQAATVLQRPIAILAEFDFPLTAVNEDGSLCTLL